MMRYVCVAILPLAAVLAPISHGMADSLPPRLWNVPIPVAPLILAQATDSGLCRRRCDFDHDTCAQAGREQGSGMMRAQLDLCRTAQRYCYRNCDRP